MKRIGLAIRAAAVAVTAVLSASSAVAALITGVTASTNMGNYPIAGVDIQNTVNGVGLSSLALNATHESTIPTNSWASATGIVTGQITFDLGGLYELDGFSFWNQNAGGPGGAGSTGLNRVEVSTSTDGVSFGLWFASGFAQVAVFGPVGPELFDPANVTASFVRFNVLSNHGDTAHSGFAEVQFDGTAVPEPSALALLGVGLAGLAAVRRRRR